MRCGDAKRELSVSREDRSAELGAHLAHCESCAAWAESCERFDALWDATRPVATDQAFASVWNRVTSAGSSRPARAAWLRFAPRVLAGTAAIAAVPAKTRADGRNQVGRTERDVRVDITRFQTA